MVTFYTIHHSSKYIFEINFFYKNKPSNSVTQKINISYLISDSPKQGYVYTPLKDVIVLRTHIVTDDVAVYQCQSKHYYYLSIVNYFYTKC